MTDTRPPAVSVDLALVSLSASGYSLGCEVVGESERAFKVRASYGRETAWIPKSVCSVDAARSYQGAAHAIVAYAVAPWFIRKVCKDPNPSARLALGLTVR